MCLFQTTGLDISMPWPLVSWKWATFVGHPYLSLFWPIPGWLKVYVHQTTVTNKNIRPQAKTRPMLFSLPSLWDPQSVSLCVSPSLYVLFSKLSFPPALAHVWFPSCVKARTLLAGLAGPPCGSLDLPTPKAVGVGGNINTRVFIRGRQEYYKEGDVTREAESVMQWQTEKMESARNQGMR